MAEGAPRHGGQELARRLAQAGLHTTLIPDSAIFAMMARVNKVAPRPFYCSSAADAFTIFEVTPNRSWCTSEA